MKRSFGSFVLFCLFLFISYFTSDFGSIEWICGLLTLFWVFEAGIGLSFHHYVGFIFLPMYYY